jgi:predicted Fe-Mo cluster-binding NifX family protein
MKIAVPATSSDLEAPADPRFGRCKVFLIVDTDTLEHEVVENTAAEEASGAGIAAAALVVNAGAKIVIAERLGPKALDALLASGVSLYEGVEGSVRDQIEAYTAGRLQPLSAPSADSKSGVDGAGPGMGGGRGRGGGGRGMGGGGRGRGGGGRGMGGGGRGRGGGGRGTGGGGRGPGGQKD